MRIAVAGALAALLLAGCGGSEEPRADDSASPTESESPTAEAEAADLGAICDALGEAVTLPHADTVGYTVTFNEPTGWATNAPVCDLEPDGEYYDVAAEAGEFGRAEFNYGVITEERLQQLGYPGYTSESAEELLALDQAEPLHDEVPCANEPCEDGRHGYQYNFRFETVMEDFAVIAQFDYITTDVSGDQQPEYRSQAIAAFNAAMDVIAAEIE